jgi:hypothetical protein
MFILGDPLILPLVTHILMCLTCLCIPHIVTFVPILPPCFIRNLWGYKKSEMVWGKSMWHLQVSISVKISIVCTMHKPIVTQNDRK